MPPLLELQRAMARALVGGDDGAAAGFIVADGLPAEARLAVYRNTFTGTLTNALRLSYPAVHQLVGAAFFEGAAAVFIEEQPPESAYLDGYGGAFAEFLAAFAPAAALSYLPGVARLEWEVNRALHAPDRPSLAVSQLACIDPGGQDRVCFEVHPSVALVSDDAPVDLIWRAVLDRDDDAMAAIDLGSGPVWLLVERGPAGIEINRMHPQAWRFAEALFARQPIEAAIAAVPDADAPRLIADHLALGRFIDFSVPNLPPPAASAELSR